MVKDYKKIITDKIKVAKVDSYDELINKLKSYNIKPQEAFNLAYKNKYQHNARYFWAMTRIGMYKNQRYMDLILAHLTLFPPAKKSKKKLMQIGKKNIRFIRKINELKKLERIPLKEQREDYAELKKRIAKLKAKLDGKKPSDQNSRALNKKISQEMRESEKKMPKKIDTCREVVSSKRFKEEFKSFYPNNKFDQRKEVQNLHKLVTEKRHRNKLFKEDKKLAINEPMERAVLLDVLVGERMKRIL